jgi:hypothetical protein
VSICSIAPTEVIMGIYRKILCFVEIFSMEMVDVNVKHLSADGLLFSAPCMLGCSNINIVISPNYQLYPFICD